MLEQVQVQLKISHERLYSKSVPCTSSQFRSPFYFALFKCPFLFKHLLHQVSLLVIAHTAQTHSHGTFRAIDFSTPSPPSWESFLIPIANHSSAIFKRATSFLAGVGEGAFKVPLVSQHLTLLDFLPLYKNRRCSPIFGISKRRGSSKPA